MIVNSKSCPQRKLPGTISVKVMEIRKFLKKNDNWKVEQSNLKVLKSYVYQTLIWKALYPDLYKQHLQTIVSSKDNTYEFSFKISYLQCRGHFLKIFQV